MVGRSLARMASFRMVLAGIMVDRNAWMDVTVYGVEAGATALHRFTKCKGRLLDLILSWTMARFKSLRLQDSRGPDKMRGRANIV